MRILFFAFSLCLLSNFALSQTTWSRIEESTDWNTCGNCGNTGGTGDTATYSMTRGITTPQLDGSSSKFSIGGSYAFKNAYWYVKRYDGPSTPVKSLKYDFYVYVPTNAYPQAIEFECQQKAGGYLYNFAWQADYAHHVWRIYSMTAKGWESTSIAFNGFEKGKWHHITAEFHASNLQTVHDALTVDGVRHSVGIKHNAKAWNTGHYLTTAFQLDLNGSAADYHVYVDKMSVTFQ